MRIIAPSLLAADFLNIKTELQRLNKSKAQWLHLDIMDGNFVPNLSFGYDIIGQMRPHCDLFFDVHLMITNPLDYVEKCAAVGADMFTFHYEAVSDPSVVIKAVKASKMKVGISINPGTDVSVLDPYLQDLDLVLIMSVNPGFGGQSFIHESVAKISYIRGQIDRLNLDCLIEVDGGINDITGKLCVDAGVDVLVAGSYLFNDQMDEKIDLLLK